MANEKAGGCRAALNTAGQHYPCDMVCVDADGNPTPDHIGWPHSNRDAQAVWQGDPLLAPSEGGGTRGAA